MLLVLVSPVSVPGVTVPSAAVVTACWLVM